MSDYEVISDDEETDYADDEDDGRERACWTCRGDGFQDGSDLAEMDPLWYDSNKVYKCINCGGSGRAEDCTFW